MKLSIIYRTSEFRGDHAADIAVAYDAVPGETTEQLAGRILNDQAAVTDWIEIRRIVEEQLVQPAPAGLQVPR